jgi:hypothetical protein
VDGIRISGGAYAMTQYCVPIVSGNLACLIVAFTLSSATTQPRGLVQWSDNLYTCSLLVKTILTMFVNTIGAYLFGHAVV